MQNQPPAPSLIDLLTPLLPDVPLPLLLLILTATLVVVLALLVAILLRHRRLHHRHLALAGDLAALQTAAADAEKLIVEMLRAGRKGR